MPLVYDELRKLAAGHMANEAGGRTLDATALVHEAYLRLVGPLGERTFANRGHFFAAAAEAMRRILVDSARRKNARKRGRDFGPSRTDVDRLPAPPVDADSWIDVDEALKRIREDRCFRRRTGQTPYFWRTFSRGSRGGPKYVPCDGLPNVDLCPRLVKRRLTDKSENR